MTVGDILTTGPINRRHYGATTYSMGTDDSVWKKLMGEWYGLKPVPGDGWLRGSWSLDWVAKRRCALPDCGDSDLHELAPVWDHTRAWRDRDGEKVLTLEPYGNPFETYPAAQFASLRRMCEDRGLDIGFEGRSPYGASYILFLKRADVPLLGLPGPRNWLPWNDYTLQPRYTS